MPIHLIIYSTSACHLCEQASAMLQALPAGTTTWQEVEISDDETLLERYGLRIPVLQRTDNGLELDWPFDTYALTEFLQP